MEKFGSLVVTDSSHEMVLPIVVIKWTHKLKLKLTVTSYPYCEILWKEIGESVTIQNYQEITSLFLLSLVLWVFIPQVKKAFKLGW